MCTHDVVRSGTSVPHPHSEPAQGASKPPPPTWAPACVRAALPAVTPKALAGCGSDSGPLLLDSLPVAASSPHALGGRRRLAERPRSRLELTAVNAPRKAGPCGATTAPPEADHNGGAFDGDVAVGLVLASLVAPPLHRHRPQSMGGPSTANARSAVHLRAPRLATC